MKKISLLTACFIGLFLIVLFSATSGPSQGESEIQRGLAIAPVPLDLTGRNHALVARGSYIVNAQADCNGCHTVQFDPYLPGGNPFVGQPEQIDPDKYLVGGSPFGPFITRNIRPDPVSGLPARLTFDQFREVMQTGRDFHDEEFAIPGTPVLQVMPWPAFRNMKEHDILAIYEYLRSLPSAP